MTKPVRPRSFDDPASRLAIETMQAWLDGEPIWPYRRVVDTWGHEFMDFRRRWHELAEERLFGQDVGEKTKLRFDREMLLFEVRMEYVARFGFAIPCAELLDALAAAAPIVEVGAGTGYMTALMRRRGIDVIGSDVDGFKETNDHGFMTGAYDPQQVNGIQAKAMARRHPDRTVFCSWPTYRETWFRQMLRAMHHGQKVIVIREDCCAEDSAWHYIDDCFEELQLIEIPNFPCIHDYAGLYVKRRQHAQGKTRTSLLG